MIIAFVLLVLLAFILMGSGVAVGIAGRGRSAGYPRCGGCDYNLTGFMGSRCPECGGLFTEVGISPSREKWRMALVLLGVFLFLVGFLLFGLLSAGVVYIFIA